MISTLILLAASLLTTPVFISDVKASREAGHLRVEVRGDGGIDPEAARTVIDDGRLIIYLGGTRVRADNRSWDLSDGAGEIRAHRHRTETELVVPLQGNGCAGPVELTGSDTGITALVGCDGTAAVPVMKRIATQKTPAKTTEIPETLKALIQLPPEATNDDRAIPPAPAVALAPARRAAPATEVPVAAAAPEDHVALPTAKTSRALATAPVPVVVASNHLVAPAAAAPILRVAAAQPVAVPAPGAAPVVGAARAGGPATSPAAGTFGTGKGGGMGSLALPGLLLGALALGAYIFARRRRGTVYRHIQILETTSLGPKRSLVVARIGDETIILGSSEAGITLLRGSSVAAATVATAGIAVTAGALPEIASGPVGGTVSRAASNDRAAFEFSTKEIEQPLQEALADIPEPDSGRGGHGRASFRAIEGGLAGLFGRRGGGFERAESAEPFAELLEDSVEDQELRQKLAAGLSARVR